MTGTTNKKASSKVMKSNKQGLKLKKQAQKKAKTAESEILTLEGAAKSFGENAAAVADILKNFSEDDPPIAFIWSNVEIFVNDVQQHIDNPSPDGSVCPFTQFLPANRPITVDQFKRGILGLVCSFNLGSIHQYDGVLPCTYPQAIQASVLIGSLCHNPWFINMINNSAQTLPLARVVTPVPRRKEMSLIVPLGHGFPISLWC